MTVLRGTGVGRGAAVGPVVRAHPARPVDPRRRLAVDGDPDAARRAVEDAFDAVTRRLVERSAAAHDAVAAVLAATAEVAADPTLRTRTLERVAAGEPVVAALDAVVEGLVAVLEDADGTSAERVSDLRSVRDRVAGRLAGEPEPGVPTLERPSVVVADDLAPVDAAALDASRTLALVTERGGPTGHTAVIAGQLGIPCVVQVHGATSLAEGTEVAVDAGAGTVTPSPDASVRAAVEARRAALAELAADRSPGRTADGHAVALLANIGTPEDAERLTDAAVEGVGLFRTEVLYLGRSVAPTEDEQVESYVRVLAAMRDRDVVVRTIDAGAEKPLAFLERAPEENPQLGVRGLRLTDQDEAARALLRGQLRSIARAAELTGTRPRVMAPMVTTAAEAARFARLARECGVTEVGVMVEVPAAALRARDVLAEVDFLSLGTNDLAQYTMAADRGLGDVASLLDPWNPALLDLVGLTAAAGAATRKPVGVCGEAAADPLLALVLVGLGMTSLSMAPAAVPAVRYALARHTLDRCRAMAHGAQAARDAAGARAVCLAAVDPEVREVLALR